MAEYGPMVTFHRRYRWSGFMWLLCQARSTREKTFISNPMNWNINRSKLSWRAMDESDFYTAWSAWLALSTVHSVLHEVTASYRGFSRLWTGPMLSGCLLGEHPDKPRVNGLPSSMSNRGFKTRRVYSGTSFRTTFSYCPCHHSISVRQTYITRIGGRVWAHGDFFLNPSIEDIVDRQARSTAENIYFHSHDPGT